jgi:hypothetical protein
VGQRPTWSSNGSEIAYQDGSVKKLVLASGSVSTLLTVGSGLEGQPDWKR